MKKTLPLPASFDKDTHDAGNIHEWLQSQGIDVESVSLVRPHKARNDSTLMVEVESGTDPAETLKEFVAQPSPEELAAEELAALDIRKADLAQLRKAVALMQTMMNTKGKPSV